MLSSSSDYPLICARSTGGYLPLVERLHAGVCQVRACDYRLFDLQRAHMAFIFDFLLTYAPTTDRRGERLLAVLVGPILHRSDHEVLTMLYR